MIKPNKKISFKTIVLTSILTITLIVISAYSYITINHTENSSLKGHAIKHLDPTYVCPMHPQIVRNKKGNCPICGMDLVKKEFKNNTKEKSLKEHAIKHLDPTYVCPMHPQIVRNKKGSCPICGMDLVKKEFKTNTKEKSLKEHAIKHLDPTYVCPMHPQIVRNKKGSCPICGMDLVKKELENNTNIEINDFPSITVKKNISQKMGIRTALVSKTDMSRIIHTVGNITYNENKLYHVHSRTNGWVEKVYIKAEGDLVKKGDTLIDFYSPDILIAEQDLLLSQQKSKSSQQINSKYLMNSAKQKLRLMNVPEKTIKSIESNSKTKNNVPIEAPKSGVITKINIRDGMYVTPKLQMYTIADISDVWIFVDVFEHNFTWLKVGNKAEIKVHGLPGKKWIGKIDYIYHELNPVNRTIKVRLKLNSPNNLLKPNMFANVTLYSPPKNVISVPSESIIYYENSTRIVKIISDGEYKPTKIKTGLRSEGKVEIIQGLQEGDRIVVSGQFMLDSESNLQASFRRLSNQENK